MKPGDHIYAKRLGYTHHGIYVGDRSVIHYSGLSTGLSKGAIELSSLLQFKGSASEYIVKQWGERAFTHDEAVKRAHSRLDEDDYNLFTNNCEHFVHWCIFGVSKSPQVREAAMTVGSGLTTAAVLHQTGTAARTAGPVIARAFSATAVSSAAARTATSASTVSLTGLVSSSAMAGGASGIAGALGIAAAPALVPIAAAGLAAVGGYYVYEWAKDLFD